MTMPPVFTPETLAERWQCSAKTIRKDLAAGRLRGFRLGGTLWRIACDEVIERENQWKTDQTNAGPSDGSASNGPRPAGSPGTAPDAANVVDLARIEARPSAPCSD